MESPRKTPTKRKRIEDTTTAKSLKYFDKIDQEMDFNEGNLEKRKKTHVCKLCKGEINAVKEWNLSSHLSNRHYDIFLEITSDKKEPIPIKRLKLLQNCTEIVSINGRPFSYIHDSGFRAIIKDKLAEIEEGKHPLNLSDKNLIVVKNHLSNTAEKIRTHIRDEVKGRPLSLMCDIVTKHNRSILGVSIQYSLNGKVKIRSIGMIELHESHTGIYLSKIIKQRLQVFNVSLKQIITITTDNGANILKMVRDMECCLQSEINQAKQNQSETQITSTENVVGLDNEETDVAIDRLLAEEREIDDDEAIQRIIDEAENEMVIDNHETLLTQIATELSVCGANIEWNITGVNCAAHTLQLGLKDGMQKLGKSHKNVIELCRQACKFLRLRSTMTEMEIMQISYRLPRLENATRWCSTYLMVRMFSFIRNYFIIESTFDCNMTICTFFIFYILIDLIYSYMTFFNAIVLLRTTQTKKMWKYSNY